jgi:hypothetical protein
MDPQSGLFFVPARTLSLRLHGPCAARPAYPPYLRSAYLRSEDQGKLRYWSRVAKQMFPYIFR